MSSSIKRVFFLFVLLFPWYGNNLQAQDAKEIISGLLLKLPTAKSDKEKALIYSDLTWYYSRYKPDSAIYYGKKAEVLAISFKDSVLLAQVYSDVGSVYMLNGTIDSSLANYKKCESIRKILRDVIGLAKCEANIGAVLFKKNELNAASEKMLNAIQVFRKNKMDNQVAQLLSNLGQIFCRTGNGIRAVQYCQDAVTIQLKQKDEISLVQTYFTLGNAHLSFNDTVNAIKYYHQSIDLAKKTNNSVSLQAVLNNLSLIELAKQHPEKAKQYAQTADSINQVIGEYKASNTLDMIKGKLLLTENKYEEARAYFFKALENDNFVGANLRARLDCYNCLAEVNGYLGNKDSLGFYLIKALVVQNQIIDNEAGKRINEVEVKYETKEKEATIQSQEKELQNKQRTIFLISISVLLLLVTALLLFLRFKNRKQNEIIQQQQKASLQVIDAEQQERMRIARELHDGIGQKLTVLKMYASVDEVANKKQMDLLDSTITEVRGLSHNLMPEILNLGLFVALRDMCDKINLSEQIKCAFIHTNDVANIQFSKNVEMSIYRIVQEVLGNMLKHAKASDIRVELKKEQDKLLIHISDNGVGFDTKTIYQSKGIGWGNILTRAKIINANLDVSSNKNGTTINLVVNL
jgi:signal transduction histidine kinase